MINYFILLLPNEVNGTKMNLRFRADAGKIKLYLVIFQH